ncbi:hypothetical protein [Niabella hibiscisoli]|uniref:hypothetical protein n=1 Tax=Niabella hibiscisoli TaxID=1825928 RepID=UPI001F0F1EB5|nr:hypothetical protein [Niabella hibiscisoli]MCH5719395.1 hypothetical protein [Niabella hibiscisoli]
MYLFFWTIIIPLLSWAGYLGHAFFDGHIYLIILSILLVGSVLAAVHHAEVIALKVGEPFGTFLLAFAITIIEVSLIVSLMMASDTAETKALARETVFAAVMIILNGIIGLCILIGALRFKEQVFELKGLAQLW